MIEQQETGNQYRQGITSNQEYVDNTSFMLARIDTTQLISRMKRDISGTVVVLLQNEKGDYYEEIKQIGRPLANPEGIMHICNLVEEITNSHTVQGNLDINHYYDFIPQVREEITDAIILNCYAWEIDDKDLGYIINKILRIVELFLTRPVNNKERESFQKEFKSSEIIQTQPKNENALSQFAGRMGGR